MTALRITDRLQKPGGAQLERLTSKSGERCQAHISYRGKDGRFLQCTNSAYPGQSFCRRHLKMLRRLEMEAGTTPPTPAEAMRCPEVAAAITAMRDVIKAHASGWIDGADGGAGDRARASLAALEQAVRHE